MLREVLQHYFQQFLWNKARIFPDGGAPDLTDAFALRRAGIKASSFQEVYWLEAVVQGAMETLVQHLAIKQDGYVKCSLCGEVLEGPVWPRVAYSCQAICTDFGNEAIQGTNLFCLEAGEDIKHKTNMVNNSCNKKRIRAIKGESISLSEAILNFNNNI